MQKGISKANMNYSLKDKIRTIHSIVLVIILHNTGNVSLFYILATQANLAPITDNKVNTQETHKTLKRMMTGILDFGSTTSWL